MFYLFNYNVIYLYIIYYTHDTCINNSNLCDIYRSSCTLLFNVYMQCCYIAFLLILLKYYTRSYIFSGYVVHSIYIFSQEEFIKQKFYKKKTKKINIKIKINYIIHYLQLS